MTFFRGALYSLTVAAALHMPDAVAKEYVCPAEIHIEPGKAQEEKGFTLWSDPQARTQIEGISLYDGPPSEMAQLKPDNGDDPSPKNSVWKVYENPRGLWMVCSYANTDKRFTIRLDAPKKSCVTKETDATQSLICE